MLHEPSLNDLKRYSNLENAGAVFAFPCGLASPEAESLIRRALRRAGRSNFSDLSFVQPLNLLLKAYAEEADLSTFGRCAFRGDVQRCLANLLRLDMAEEEDPSIRARPIRSPVFITGMPRSATSFLHQLLSLDPANAVPRCWQLIYPYPLRSRLLPFDPRKLLVDLELQLFRCMTPGLGALHELSADEPQECTDITAQVFQSLRFESTHRIPSYQAWIDRHGHRHAFLFHRRFLQHLDVQMPTGNGDRRWVLKSPDHVFTLDAIRTVYPDAKIVFLHRDPLSVIPSCVKLTERLHRPFTNHLDRQALGRQVTARLNQAADHMIAAASRLPDILHLYYREVVSRPLEAVRTLYRHSGMALSENTEQRMTEFLARQRRRTAPRYDFAMFGLDAGILRERFSAYVRHFAVPMDALSGR